MPLEFLYETVCQCSAFQKESKSDCTSREKKQNLKTQLHEGMPGNRSFEPPFHHTHKNKILAKKHSENRFQFCFGLPWLLVVSEVAGSMWGFCMGHFPLAEPNRKKAAVVELVINLPHIYEKEINNINKRSDIVEKESFLPVPPPFKRKKKIEKKNNFFKLTVLTLIRAS